MYISRLSMEPGLFAAEISWMNVIQKFSPFLTIYATILSEIDKFACQIVYHLYSRGNPRPPCGKSWLRIITVGHQSGLEDTTMPQ